MINHTIEGFIGINDVKYLRNIQKITKRFRRDDDDGPYLKFHQIAFALCASLFLIMPGFAANTAVYGNTAGLNLTIHSDTFSVTCLLPGLAGSEIDSNLSCFINSSTDIIILGGDAGFSQNTQSRIINATASGKILLLSNGDISRFSDILPVKSSGIFNGSTELVETIPSTTLSQDVFAGLPSTYPNYTIILSGEMYVLRQGATSLLSFDNGDPALAYTPYGNGYVIVWLPPSNQAYLNSTDADLINERLITHLLALRTSAATSTQTPEVSNTSVSVENISTTTTPTITTTNSGNISLFSSPSGANVFIDNIYEGITPVNLTGISVGTHSLKLQMDGYSDYETTVSITGGPITVIFGELQMNNSTNHIPPTEATTNPDSSSIWSNPTLLAAVLGSIAAIIGAIATIFSLLHKQK